MLVEWLFYPEYVDLKDLEEDYKRITEENKDSELMEEPCRFPVSNQGMGHTLREHLKGHDCHNVRKVITSNALLSSIVNAYSCGSFVANHQKIRA